MAHAKPALLSYYTDIMQTRPGVLISAGRQEGGKVGRGEALGEVYNSGGGGGHQRVRAVDEALLAERHEAARAQEQRALHRARHRERPTRHALPLVCRQPHVYI
ncbi:hypothetical protein RR48_01937 [Papilio machaon]|uniref:Uncharacterized protein n=1 Tax=Papilio machaon TaxID=76193 RepID=A0A0N1IEM8_PAPMA|nr:hypothetical protein RR48_01937 [Papilio machaon]